jgi:hypothetical protein
MILGVADYGIASAGEIFFGGTSYGRIESGEYEIAIERWVETSDDEISCRSRDRFVEVPVHGLGISFSGGALRGGYFS